MENAYLSSNGWIAWVAPDSIIIDPLFNNKGKFVIAGYTPSGKFCVAPSTYNNALNAEAVIHTFDPQTITFEYEDYTIRVFKCFDNTYWWSGTSMSGDSYPTQRIYAPYDMQHAVALARSALYSLCMDDGIPF